MGNIQPQMPKLGNEYLIYCVLDPVNRWMIKCVFYVAHYVQHNIKEK